MRFFVHFSYQNYKKWRVMKKNREHVRTYRRINIQKHLFVVLNFFVFHSVMKVWEQLSTKSILLTANLTPQIEVILIYFAPIRKRKVVCEVRYGTIMVRKRYRKNNVISYRTVLDINYRTVLFPQIFRTVISYRILPALVSSNSHYRRLQ